MEQDSSGVQVDIPGTFPRLKILILLTSVNSYMKFIYPLPVTYHALMLLKDVNSCCCNIPHPGIDRYFQKVYHINVAGFRRVFKITETDGPEAVSLVY